MDNFNKQFMLEAIKLAERNVTEGLGGPFGAVVVKDGNIIAKSGNLVTTTHDPTAHAEIAAIRLACQILGTHDLSGCIIYASCEPCPMCLSAIYWSRIGYIFYGNTKNDAAAIGFDDEFIYRELEKAPENRTIPVKQCMKNEAAKAFSLWENSSIKISY